jgi:hypothetical protein
MAENNPRNLAAIAGHDSESCGAENRMRCVYFKKVQAAKWHLPAMREHKNFEGYLVAFGTAYTEKVWLDTFDGLRADFHYAQLSFCQPETLVHMSDCWM